MIGGQVVDLEAEHSRPDLPTLEYIHRAKTAALITASLVSGGIYSGGNDSQIQRLRTFGQQIGLAFQIVDDVLDLTQTSEQLGKTAGKDTAAEKTTYPSLFGIDESLKKADALVASAFAQLGTIWSASGHSQRTGPLPGRTGRSEASLPSILPFPRPTERQRLKIDSLIAKLLKADGRPRKANNHSGKLHRMRTGSARKPVERKLEMSQCRGRQTFSKPHRSHPDEKLSIS